MKYIYFLYSENLNEGYFGSSSIPLNRRFAFHKNDSKKGALSCIKLFEQEDVKIEPILTFNDFISKMNLEKIEHHYIEHYYKNKQIFYFKNNHYRILNKRLSYVNKREFCNCGCSQFLTKQTIKKHLNNNIINNN